MSKTLYALLVGINNYHPSSKVRKLRGCVNDIDKMEKHLRKDYSDYDLQIVSLKNEQATRENIIRVFESHLCKQDNIQEGDIALFYFSGHGSFAKTAPEFYHLDSKRQDELLVCYDSRLPGNYDLADKEIAVLLSKIKSGVHILSIIDACYSGSIYRSSADEANVGLARFEPNENADQARDLATYFLSEEDNYYLQLKNENKRITIPEATYVGFASCNRDQKAVERDAHGLFSSKLLDILKRKNNQISYSRLADLISITMKTHNKNQSPILIINGGFDPRKAFLSDSIINEVALFKVYSTQGEWRLNHGLIYGFPSEQTQIDAIRVGIYQEQEADKPADLVDIVTIKSVHQTECYLNFNYFVGFGVDARFSAIILNALPTTFVYLNGSQEDKKEFLELAQGKTSPFTQFVEIPDGLRYELQLTSDEFRIHNLQTGELIHGCKTQHLEVSVNYILDCFEQIDKYDTILSLNNPATDLEVDKVDFQFFLEDKNGKDMPLEGDVITLNYEEEDIPFNIKVRNRSSRELHFAFIIMSSKYEISNKTLDYTLMPINENTDADTDDNWLLLNQLDAYIGDKNKDSIIDYCKLIVSTRHFEGNKYSLKKLDPIIDPNPEVFREIKERGGHKPPTEDWFTKTIKIETIRTKGKLDKSDTTIGPVTFKGHADFRASVNFSPLENNNRSTHPANQLREFCEGTPFQMIDLKSSNQETEEPVIILNDVKSGNSLTRESLNLNLQIQAKDNEFVIPFTFEGEYFLPVGNKFIKTENGFDLSIHQVPDSLEDSEEDRTRGTLGSLWFCLLNFVAPDEDVFRLNYIWKYEGNKVEYGNLELPKKQEKVKEASKILLLIHGMYGDTENMTKAVQPLLKKRNMI